MKTTQLFRLLTVMILPVITHAQNLSIEDLVQASQCRDHECYDAYVTAKGFHFYKQLDKSGDQYVYQSDAEFSFKGNKGELLNAHEDCYFLLRSDSSAVSYFATNRKERYTILMDEIKTGSLRNPGLKMRTAI